MLSNINLKFEGKKSNEQECIYISNYLIFDYAWQLLRWHCGGGFKEGRRSVDGREDSILSKVLAVRASPSCCTICWGDWLKSLLQPYSSHIAPPPHTSLTPTTNTLLVSTIYGSGRVNNTEDFSHLPSMKQA